MLYTPSSYFLDAHAPTSRARFFHAPKAEKRNGPASNVSFHIPYRVATSCLTILHCHIPLLENENDYLEKKDKGNTAHSPFQVVGQFT